MMAPKIADVLAELESMKKLMLTKEDLAQIKEEIRAEFAEELSKKDESIIQLQNKLAVCQGAISTLKKCANQSEQYSRRQSLRIHGVQKKKGEKAEDCLNMVRGIIKQRKLDIPDTVLDRAHRIMSGRNGGKPVIIVKFST